ncbi:MAG: excisionase family DNA-binding protein [Actinomycetota bacterium]|nr:excisionase family DNA-binding protein [Actinomycetota bacterium]
MSSTKRPTPSVAETADLLGISRWLVQRAGHDGSLPSVRVGRRILIPRSRLVAWLDGQQGPGAPGAGVLGSGRHSAHPGEPALTVLAPRSPHAN